MGLEDATSVEIIVSDPDNWPPVALLEAEPACGMAPLTVNFDASGSQDPDGEIVRYEFDFGEGDGWEDNGSSPVSQHEYTSADTFEVHLRVVDNQGATATYTVTIVAYDQPPTPPHVVTVYPTSGETGEEMTLGVTVTGMPPFNYFWDLGGGALPDPTEGESPTVALGGVGNYSASVTVSNPGGQDTRLFILEVRPGAPPVRFEVITVPPVTWPAVDFIKILPRDPIVRRNDGVDFDLESGSVDPMDPVAYEDALKINGAEFTFSIADWEIYPRITVVEGSDPSVIDPGTTGIGSVLLPARRGGAITADVVVLTRATGPGDPVITYAYRLFDVDDSIVAQDTFQVTPTDITPPPPEGRGWGINVWNREEREIGDQVYVHHVADGGTCGSETPDVLWVEFSNGWMFDTQSLAGLNTRLVLKDQGGEASHSLPFSLRMGETGAAGNGYICTHEITSDDFRRPDLPDWPGILEPGHTYDVGLDDPLTSGVDFVFDAPLEVTGTNPWDK
jgi:PKD repeat protein